MNIASTQKPAASVSPSGSTPDGEQVPVIVTMKDDLAAAQQGGTVPAVPIAPVRPVVPAQPTPSPAPAMAPRPVPPVAPAKPPLPSVSPVSASSVPVRTVPSVSAASRPSVLLPAPALKTPPSATLPVRPTPVRKSIALPSTSSQEARGPQRSLRLLLLSAGVVVLVGLAVVGVWWTRRSPSPAPVPVLSMAMSASIGDVLPKETLAALVISRNTSDAVRAALVTASTASFGGPERVGSIWTEVAYLLLPGASPAEPVPALLVRTAGSAPDRSSSDAFTVKPVAGDAVLIVHADAAGRVHGLSGATLKDDTSASIFMNMLATPSAGAFFLRDVQVAALLNPFLFRPLAQPAAVAGMMTEGEDGVLRLTVDGLATGEGTANWTELTKALPDSALTAQGRIRAVADIDAWRAASANDPLLTAFLAGLAKKSASVTKLQQALSGPYLTGSLATSRAGVRDGFLLLQLQQGSADSVRKAFASLEGAFGTLGSAIAGTPSGDTAFSATTYAGTPIRYLNFGAPERAFDYVITDSLLVIATSRDAIRTIVDAMTAPDAHSAAMSFPELQVDGSPAWMIFRPDAAVTGELPSALQPFAAIVRRVMLDAGTPATGTLELSAPALPSPSPVEPITPSAPSPSA